MSDEPREEPRPATLWAAVGQHMGYGLTWALSTLLFLLIGLWADGKLGTRPFLTILGAFIGGAAGFYSMYRHMVVDPRERGRSDEGER